METRGHMKACRITEMFLRNGILSSEKRKSLE